MDSRLGKAGSSDFSALTLLGVAFVVLKLCEIITWNWIWVLAPFWIVPCCLIVFCAVALLFLSFAIVLAFFYDLADKAIETRKARRMHE